MAVTAVLVVGMTTLIAFGLKWTIGLRPTREMELIGLDESEHGEKGYIYDANSI